MSGMITVFIALLGGGGGGGGRLRFLHDHCLEDSQDKDLPLMVYFTEAQ